MDDVVAAATIVFQNGDSGTDYGLEPPSAAGASGGNALMSEVYMAVGEIDEYYTQLVEEEAL